MEILMFTKMLKNTGNLPLEEAATRIANIGFDGADLTVREGGYVIPGEAFKKMPRAIAILESSGLNVPMITTNVTDAHSNYAEEIFKTASQCGVKYIKLGYWRYAGFGKIRKQIEDTLKKIHGICYLSREYGVTATIHIHAGAFLSADPALVFMLLKDQDPEHLGAYIDPGHMFAETGPAGWEMAIDLLAPYIKIVAVKNYRWIKVSDEETGEKKWRTRMMPLKEEIVLWPEVFACLKKTGFDGCVSIHSEYSHLNLEGLIKQTREDFSYLKGVLNNIYPRCKKKTD